MCYRHAKTGHDTADSLRRPGQCKLDAASNKLAFRTDTHSLQVYLTIMFLVPLSSEFLA